MGDFKYKAFISYSHKDRKWTRWLHRRLETYPIPKNIIGNVTSAGTIPRRLKPIFRDREELSASNNLGEKIQAALASSKNLIIICSPAAAKSKWVNQEILTFKQNNRDAQLFSVIVEGEPYASTMPGRENEECFPPALRYEVNEDGTLSDTPAEPLAADLRPHADGKRLGFLKLISGMIGVGLDDVVQRDMKRSRKRVTAITTGSLATVLAMGTLTGFALDARSKAEIAQAEAEAGRNDAEESIEFMLTDLKPELEKVGRLGALKVMGKRAEAYYGKYPVSKHNDEALGRRSRVFHFLGGILYNENDLNTANDYFMQAYQATQELLERNPDNLDRIYGHAHSAYWQGFIPYERNNFSVAEKNFKQYRRLAERLYLAEPDEIRGQLEKADSSATLGTLYLKYLKPQLALENYKEALPYYKRFAKIQPHDIQTQLNLANAYAWIADAYFIESPISKALEYRNKQLIIHTELLSEYPKDFRVIKEMMRGQLSTSELLFLTGETDKASILLTTILFDAERLFQSNNIDLNLLELIALVRIGLVEVELRNGNLEKVDNLLTNIDKHLVQLNLKGELTELQKRRIFAPAQLFRAELAYRAGNYIKSISHLHDMNAKIAGLDFSTNLRGQEIFIRSNNLLGKNYLAMNESQHANALFDKNINFVKTNEVAISSLAKLKLIKTYHLKGDIKQAQAQIIQSKKIGFLPLN